MRIAEIYRSVQGEGLLTGVPSVFVRASGCNLRCWFCDTPYASWRPEGRDMSTDEIVAQVEEWDTRHVVVTGGEPMLFAELIPLCEQLQAVGRHERERHRPEVVRRLFAEYTYQIKFVIDSPADLELVGEYLAEFHEISRE